MGLDKWLKSEDQANKKSKNKRAPVQAKKNKNINYQSEIPEIQTIKLKKYILVCPRAKCKYQKIIMKKKLTETDRTCPKCNGEMIIK
ncbi:MAG: hypothetical protein ACFFB0_00980 [Promethearchaeota archaeon]